MRNGQFAEFLTEALRKMVDTYDIVCIEGHVPCHEKQYIYLDYDAEVKNIGYGTYPLWDISEGLDGMAVVLTVRGCKGLIRLYTNKPTSSKYTKEQIEKEAKRLAELKGLSPITLKQVEDQYLR
jgi:hypothetical protein